MSAGHQRGSVSSTFLTSTYAATDEQKPLLLQLVAAPGRVLILGVSTVDDHVTGREQWHQLINERVDSTTG